MLSAVLKEHTAKQGAVKKDLEQKRVEATTAAKVVADTLVDSLNEGVAEVFAMQRQLENEVKQLHAGLARFSKTSAQWISMVDSFNQALKEIGDVENWSERIEADMRTIALALEYAHNGKASGTADSPTP